MCFPQIYSFLEEYERVFKEAKDDVSKYLANPINAYVLVKRLTSDLSEMESVLSSDGFLGYSILSVFKAHQFKVPFL